MSDISFDFDGAVHSPLPNNEINQNKVAKIRDAWRKGDYKPDSKLIAGHLVEWFKSE